jgi:hypothetical protein
VSVQRRSPSQAEFVRRVHLDTDEVLGARWWNESFQAFQAGPRRRQLLGAVPLLIGGGITAAVLGAVLCSRDDDDDSAGITLDAIDLQRREGWNAGEPDRTVSFASLSTDVRGQSHWMERMPVLAPLLEPDPHLRTLAVPTLFQALSDPANQSLRQVMRPVNAPEADGVFARGEALRGLTEQPDAPKDLALIIDLPGPQSVALAASLATRFCPVFTFDNWPHPLGVVPSHLTLGACLYYLPVFIEARMSRPQPPLPMFVLDANRLAPYRDQANQFDNRYVAPMPSAGSLRGAGVKRVLYIRPDAGSLTELDDLNGDFVAWQQAGIEVRALPLSDFTAADVQFPARADAGAVAQNAHGGSSHYYYGGHSYHHLLFWRSYGYGIGSAPTPSRRLRTAPPPPRLSGATSYRPSYRPTLFSSRAIGGVAAGVGKQKPSGFGRVSVRMNSSGRLTAVGSRRSGSFGRSRSSYSS